MPATNGTTTITVCDTCKRPDWEARAPGRSDGEAFAEVIEAAARGRAGVEVRRTSCLMGCGLGCNLAIQAEGKIAYVLGGFEPGMEAAAAVVDYAGLHAGSETGQVPLKQWPQGVRGHFRAKLPPLDPR